MLKTEDARKVHLEPTYPYTYARVSAMKSKLIRKEDYDKLLKMKTNEIIKFLQETEYRKEMDEFSMTASGVNLVELALNRNFTRAMLKLKRISDNELRLLIEEYLRRMDIHNIKTILRAKFTKMPWEYAETLLVPAGRLKKEDLAVLMKMESVEDIVKSLRRLLKADIDFTDALKSLKEKNSIFEIENALDRHYYSDVLEFVEKVPKEGELFVRFLKHEIDILNINTILRLKKEKADKKEIQKYLFYSGLYLKRRMLSNLTAIDDIQELIGRIKREGYKKAFEEDTRDVREKKEEKSLVDIEVQLKRYLLNKAALLLHQHPLSIDVILGYMFSKEIEIRNLKTLLKGKQLGVEENFIARELVVGK